MNNAFEGVDDFFEQTYPSEDAEDCREEYPYETRILENMVDEGYRLKKPIAVLIQRRNLEDSFGHSVIHFFEGESYVLNGQCEATIEKAIDEFFLFIVDLLKDYEENQDSLGAVPKKQYAHLNEILEKC